MQFISLFSKLKVHLSLESTFHVDRWGLRPFGVAGNLMSHLSRWTGKGPYLVAVSPYARTYVPRL